jgi:hypothetical protein
MRDSEIHATLRQIVLDSEPLLRHVWSRRGSDRDVLVLADMRRQETPGFASGWWPEDAIRRATAAEGHLAFLP